MFLILFPRQEKNAMRRAIKQTGHNLSEVTCILFGLLLHFSFNPLHNEIHDFVYLFIRESLVWFHIVPLIKTTPTATSSSVLSYKNRVTSHRGLLPVVGDNLRGKSGTDKIFSVKSYGVHTFVTDISLVCLFQMKGRAEI